MEPSSEERYPAKTHRDRLRALLQPPSGTIAYFRGNSLQCRRSSDTEEPFRQFSDFYFLCGLSRPSSHLVIDFTSHEAYAFLEEPREADEVWHGEVHDLTYWQTALDVEHVKWEKDLESVIECLRPDQVFVLPDENLSRLRGMSFPINVKSIREPLSEARVRKDDYEIGAMRVANAVSSAAHVQVMKALQTGSSEAAMEALFRYHCRLGGCKFQAYMPIVGVGTHAAILHYGDNQSPIENPHELLLIDAAGEYNMYAADITRTLPVSGKFTPEAKAIYNIVLCASDAVQKELRPGVQWADLHMLASRKILEGLLSLGILQGSLDSMIKDHVHAVFFPHGLGHLIGLDVHDVGGYPEGVPRIDQPALRYLRMHRPVQSGMVVTVEPGCYFNPSLLKTALADPHIGPYIVTPKLDQYRPIGGVRIEDCIVVTEKGLDVLTTAPRTVQDIERVMSSSTHPPGCKTL